MRQTYFNIVFFWSCVKFAPRVTTLAPSANTSPKLDKVSIAVRVKVINLFLKLFNCLFINFKEFPIKLTRTYFTLFSSLIIKISSIAGSTLIFN